MTATRERAAWRRDKATDVYADAMAYAQAIDSRFVRLTDPEVGGRSRPEVAHVNQITARMRMVEPDAVFGAWKALRDTEAEFVWAMPEEFPGLGHTDEVVPDDHVAVVALRAAVNEFYAVT